MQVTVLKKVIDNCPICGETHAVNFCVEYSREFAEFFYECTNSNSDENRYVNGKIMDDNIRRHRQYINRCETKGKIGIIKTTRC